ncbi:formylglycine-generating enzyme family protein [Desulfosarcina sp. OttesenSCG-928-A07]|nr:formylglycine-generating enzyme family protein [Desulfosarcina sp. OttesenSCG-928-G17]MDL2329820.1 formylglycine-generating enzyme family protein [Desulfosarcina sp. OttesenSCG-928-A07]
MKKVFLPLFLVLVVCLFCFSPVFAQEKTHTNSIGMEFVLIPAGSFEMGCDPNFENCAEDECPRYTVTLTQAFYLGKYEVTQAQWVAMMGSNPSKYKGRTNPVEQVSWDDVQDFIQQLNEKEDTRRYRLPTEAEWEYAARAGSQTAYSFGDDARQLGNYAWYDRESGPYSVGQKRANKWGLYDVHGNVYEWVADWYQEDYYTDNPGKDPQGPSSGKYRVIRGGSWFFSAEDCRSANRNFNSPDHRISSLGFRLACSVKK